jgi:DNA-binding NarL/FixJ family response regulator
VTKQIRVVLVEDHAVVREGVKIILAAQPDIAVVGEAEDGQSALIQVRAALPDVVVIDVGLPDANGLDVTRQIRAELPDTAVVVLTMYEGEEYFFAALQAGASGYVVKRAASTELIAAIRAVHQGAAYLQPKLTRRLLDEYMARERPTDKVQPAIGNLSTREVEVLRLVAEGQTSRAIAQQLGLSVKTVERHRENIMGKLNLYRRTDLVRYAMEHGMMA